MTVSHSIPNLFAVEQDILRGGQPGPDGWAYLKGEGIICVIKLNTEEEGSDAAAEAMGMVVHRFPIPWWRQTIWHPNKSDVISSVELLQPHSFIHCEHGMDRTGLIVACFRVWKQSLKKQDAEDEMMAHGFHNALRGLWEFWEDRVS